MKGVWKSVSMRLGVPSVMDRGQLMMPMLPVDNWDMLLQVYKHAEQYESCSLLLLLPPSGATAFTNAFFGQGVGPIYLDDFLCRGTENSLLDCPNGGLNMIDFCNGHADDAGVRCPESECAHTFSGCVSNL